MKEPKMSPSTYMRSARPENYSDTVGRVSYDLDGPVLDHHLDTITSRNQTHEFEIFCRKLCERAICQNLRPQTGPDGGGDSKTDSETLPVSDEIAMRTYVGEPNAGREKWAFAFSAKEDWVAKAKSDVAGIAGTNRGYQRVFFVTSRYAKSKTRAKLEQDLTAKHGFEVTIHDRTWIMQQVLDFDRKDLAFNYLHVGQEVTANAPLGPNDYSRSRQLEDIEKALADPTSFEGMRIQEVSEALVAAKLSRSLEKPRFETEGRFARAVRLADSHGTARQKMEARYESLWTAVWWFDDIAHLNAHYDAIEALIIDDDSAPNLEFLSNLSQMLINAVLHKDLTKEECKLEARLSRLYARLDELMVDKTRPNNALECEVLRLHGLFNAALLGGDRAALAPLWPKYSGVLSRARTLGEFDAHRLVKLIEIMGHPAGNDPAYTALVEEAAAFISERTGSAEGALLLLRRAQKLTLDDKFEMIRLLGKAARQLTKKEYSRSLIAALFLLAKAYRSAGLFWAARATCIFAAASIVIEGEQHSELDARIIPAIEPLAWISLELRHIPDFLHAVQLLNGCLAGLPLDDELKEKLKEVLTNFDLALGSHFLNYRPPDLNQLGALPDVLERLGLIMARTSLLYAMGHERILREDGSLPPEETDEGAVEFLTALACQPVSDDIRGPLITNTGEPQQLQATVMGMVVEVACGGATTTALVAEAIIASIEACFATAFELEVHPHTERFKITVDEADGIDEPSLTVDETTLRATVAWPRGMSHLDYDGSAEAIRFFTYVALMTMAATCLVHSTDVIDKLTDSEAVFDRVSMISVVGNSYHRLYSRSLARITDWQDLVQATYTLQEERPHIARPKSPVGEEAREAVEAATEEQKKTWTKDASHRDVQMRSVIDYHLWNKAGWKGALYLSNRNAPPMLGLMFTNEEAARAIFGRWRERFGQVDREDELYISILKDVSPSDPFHYTMLVSSNPAKMTGNSSMIMTRMHRMHAVTDEHVRHFLSDYDRMGVYLLMPAILKGSEPEPLFDLMILKRNLVVKSAKLIGPNEIEQCAMIEGSNSHLRGDPAA